MISQANGDEAMKIDHASLISASAYQQYVERLDETKST